MTLSPDALASQDGPDEEPAGFLVIPPLDLAPGTLLVAVGPGASGKSTYAATATAVDVVVCLDSLAARDRWGRG